jgi:hypothetical protein
MTFCGQKEYVLRVRMRLSSTSHLWARNNPDNILEIGYQILFSFSVWTGIVEDVVVGPYLTAQRYCAFLENVLSGCFKMCHYLRGRDCGFRTIRATALWGRYPIIVERDISWKVGWISRADGMSSSVAISKCHGLFVWRHLKKHVYAVPPKTIQNLVERFQAAFDKDQ